jgi:hypothetical protein
MTDHIIHSTDGQTYDLTTNRIAFGLLPKDVQDALCVWPHGIELFLCGPDKWNRWESAPPYDLHSVSEFVYRACLAPKVTEYVLYWREGYDATTYLVGYDTHRIIVRDDGKGNLTATVEKL